MLAAAFAAADLSLTELQLTVVEGSRVAKSASPARSQSHVAIKIVCVTCLLALPRNPLS